MTLRSSLVLAALLGAVITASGQSSDPPAANPGRPTVTNPATLTPIGYVQSEQGYLGSNNSPNTAAQYGVNQVMKFTVLPRLMLVAGFQPFADSRLTGVNRSTVDPGGIQLGFQAVLFSPAPPPTPSGDPTTASPPGQKSPVPTVAIGYYHTVYGGTAPDIDLGSASNSLVLLLSGDIRGFHYDTNYLLNEQDDDSSRGDYTIHRAQFAQTLSVNHSIGNPNLQLSVELYHFSQPTVHATSAGIPIARANQVGLLIAPSYQIRSNLVIDAGFSRGLTSTSTQWQTFAGFTYVLPHRLWPERRKR